MITTDNTATLVNALAEIERLTAERDAAQADAKRYQWVKKKQWLIDAAVDKAMKGEQS